MSETTGVKCSRDGSLMVFTYESENLKGDIVRISLYYKCPLCGARREIEEIRIERSEKDFLVTRRLHVTSTTG
jgi:hypothetical protein